MTKRRNLSPTECKKFSVHIDLKVIKPLSRGLNCIMMEDTRGGPVLSKEIAFVERILLGSCLIVFMIPKENMPKIFLGMRNVSKSSKPYLQIISTISRIDR